MYVYPLPGVIAGTPTADPMYRAHIATTASTAWVVAGVELEVRTPAVELLLTALATIWSSGVELQPLRWLMMTTLFACDAGTVTVTVSVLANGWVTTQYHCSRSELRLPGLTRLRFANVQV